MKRNFIQKLASSALALLCACMCFAPAAAETIVYEENEYTYIFQNDGFREGWSINTGIFTASGQPAYCIEPSETIAIGENIYETASWETYNAYSEQLKQQITEYTCFGYGYGNHTDMEYWYAAQILIWQAIDPDFKNTRVYRDPSYDGGGYMSANTVEITGRIAERKQEIQNVVDNYHTEPLITLTDSKGNVLSQESSIPCGESVRICDSAGVIDDYEVSASSGSLKRESHEAILETTQPGEVTVTFSYDLSASSLTGAPVLLKPAAGSKAQSLVIRGNADTKTFVLNFHVEDQQLRIRKLDEDTGENPHGEAVLKGARYLLTDLTEDQEAGIFETDGEGCSQIISGLNLYHTYRLSEICAPQGYQKADTPVSFCLEDIDKENGIYLYSVTDQVIRKKLKIHKVVSDRAASGISRDEEGAQFTVLRNSTISHYGSFEKALTHWDEIPDDEKSCFETDANGIGISDALVYGTYTVRQTCASSPELQLCSDFLFIVNEKTDEEKAVEISNIQNEYDLKIVKKDAESSALITRSPAAFQIFHSDGSTVKQKVGSRVYDVFMTASDEPVKTESNVYQDSSSLPGTLTLPYPLDPGDYVLKEIQAPYGYEIDRESIPFTVSAENAQADESPLIVLTVYDTQKSGSIKLLKTLRESHADTSLINCGDLSGMIFSVTAKEEIRSLCDGKVIADKDSEICRLITDETGRASADQIPFGTYEIREIQAPAGVKMTAEIQDVTIDENQAHIDITAVNDTVVTKIRKTDISGENEIAGALLNLCDENGNLIDEWISTEEPHWIEGLDENGVYVLTEKITPVDAEGNDLGYVLSSPVTFTPAMLTDNTAVMKNQTVTVSKQDMADSGLSGARLCVIDEYGSTVDSWTSQETEHRVKGLKEGGTYTLHEELPPQGYYQAEDIVFSLADASEDMHIVMHDSMIRVRIRKCDERTGEDLAGVELKLYEIKDEEGNEIEKTLIAEWVTDGNPKDFDGILKASRTYLLEESEGIAGVYKAASMEFRIDLQDPCDDTPLTIVMIDADVKICAAKTDQNGRYLAGAHLQVSGQAGNLIYEWISTDHTEDLTEYLKGGETYILSETEAPEGYACIEPIVFTVSGTPDRPQVIHAADRPAKVRIHIQKTDAEDSTPLADCELGVFETETGRLAHDQSGRAARVTTDEEGNAWITLPALSQGYYVRELKAPNGYRLNTSRFPVEYDHTVNPAVRIVTVHVTDEKTSVPTGARLMSGSLLIVSGILLALMVIVSCVRRHC